MFDLDQARAATARDFDALLDRFEVLDAGAWAAPVRCEGWVVADLAEHLCAAAHGQAEGLRRAMAGRMEVVPLRLDVDRRPDALVATLRDGRRQLAAALEAVTPAVLAGPIPLPFGLVPAPVALQIIPIEYGFHRNDLEWALGNEEPLHTDTAQALLDLLPGLLPMLAGGTAVSPVGTPPTAPVTIRLAAPGATLTLAYDGAAWAPAAGDAADGTCEVAGDDNAVALFAMGRIPADHPSLKVSGDRGVAARFKRFFPGP